MVLTLQIFAFIKRVTNSIVQIREHKCEHDHKSKTNERTIATSTVQLCWNEGTREKERQRQRELRILWNQRSLFFFSSRRREIKNLLCVQIVYLQAIPTHGIDERLKSHSYIKKLFISAIELSSEGQKNPSANLLPTLFLHQYGTTTSLPS